MNHSLDELESKQLFQLIHSMIDRHSTKGSMNDAIISEKGKRKDDEFQVEQEKRELLQERHKTHK